MLTAYGERCALTGLPEPRLIDAARIIVDRDEDLGQPVVLNGLPLSKIHHAAFDANLIGIDPDYNIHVSEALLSINDGPMFEHGVKGLVGRQLRLLVRCSDYPDRERLAQRFESFLLAADPFTKFSSDIADGADVRAFHAWTLLDNFQ